jgi:hypothetical protein
MKFPILEFDPSPEALLEPAKLIQPHPEMPLGCVLCFFHDVIRHLGGAEWDGQNWAWFRMGHKKHKKHKK